MQRIVIFDMDGTLIDSAADITLSINYVRKHHYGLDDLSQKFVVDAINASERNLAYLFYETEHYDEQAKALFEEHYHTQCIQNVRAYQGISDVLHNLHSQGCILGVATNAPSKFAKRMLSHLNLSDYFTHIIGADDVQFSKPHPQMIECHLENYGFVHTRDRAWMIGDNTKDMDAARNAMISSIFATWGFSEDGVGDYKVAHPLELSAIILEETGDAAD
ncbi:MAG: HAD family hydrolase [Epsilonproteobacteria bacterium]|nr:HAD family hydrolase [Campylobacterota bacterium]